MRITKATYHKRDKSGSLPFVLLEFDDDTKEKFRDAKMYFLPIGYVPTMKNIPAVDVQINGQTLNVSGLVYQPDAALALLPFAKEETEAALVDGQILYSSG